MDAIEYQILIREFNKSPLAQSILEDSRKAMEENPDIPMIYSSNKRYMCRTCVEKYKMQGNVTKTLGVDKCDFCKKRGWITRVLQP